MRIAFLAPIPYEDCKLVADHLQQGKSLRRERLYWLTQLALRLADDGHYLNIISIESDTSLDVYTEMLEIHAIRKMPYPHIRILFDFQYEIYQIERVLRNSRFDIAHVHWSYEYAAAAIKRYNEKTLITLHDWPESIAKYFSSVGWKLRIKIGVKNIKRGVYFTGVSPYICEVARNTGKNIRLIPNWISDRDILQDKITSKFNPEKFKMISVNQCFDQCKNVGNVMLIFDALRNVYPKAELFLIGSDFGEDGKANRWAVKQKISTDNIHFLGRLAHSDVIKWFEACDVMLSCSREESFGLTFIEAMANRCLAVGGESSGAVPWILDYGKSGILIDVDNIQISISKILNVLKSREWYEKLVENAYDRVCESFSFNRIVEEYENEYQRIYAINNGKGDVFD